MTIRRPGSVVERVNVDGGRVSSTRIGPSHVRHGAFAVLVLLVYRPALHRELLEIALRFLGAGGRDLVSALAEEATGDTAALVDTFGCLGAVREETVALRTLVVIWGRPSRREGCSFRFSVDCVLRRVSGNGAGREGLTEEHRDSLEGIDERAQGCR